MNTRTVKGDRRTLDEQREEFKNRRFLAMPLAGTIAWLLVGIAGLYLTPFQSGMFLFIATGSIAYLGMFLSQFTGEHFLSKDRPKNTFDTLFLLTVLMALLVHAIAIPFFLRDHSSLPLSVGILTGLMWIPLSWAIEHWVGLFHGITRTLLILAAWHVFPAHRFVLVPLLIVGLYLITIIVLEKRWRKLKSIG